MEFLKLINLGLRFLLEICVLLIFGYWGFKTCAGTLLKIFFGIGGPILFAIVWGTLPSPKSSMRLQEPWKLLLELVIFVLAFWALYSTGKVSLGIAFGVLYLINMILMVIWRL